ncbi:MAG TPA: hypothetical protein VFE29_03955 [Terriglobia bacterium]|nr:hypothetical protein [Terriglobia bacterium]
MNPRNLFFAVASVIVMGASFTLMSQGLTDGVKVTLPYPVTVDEVVLEPGEYEIRRASSTTDQILRFFDKDKLRYQTVAITIPAEEERPPEETKILLHHIGDKYYFDKIWMEGKTYGYEFPLPERARALQRELAVTVPAKYESVQGAAVTESAAAQVQVPVPQGSNPVENSPADAAAQESQNREVRDAQVEPFNNDPQQVAVLQQEQRETPAPGIDSRQQNAQAGQDAQRPRESVQTSQDNAAAAGRERDELPATASNWLAYMLGGGLLLMTAGLLRRTATVRG